MKFGTLCLLLLAGCSSPDPSPIILRYALTWTCLSPAGCERTAEVERIDHMEQVGGDCQLTSTQDEAFVANATQIPSDLLPEGCSWLYFLSLFGHELERSRICFGPVGFEMELSIPNEDPASSSMWLVEGRYADL